MGQGKHTYRTIGLELRVMVEEIREGALGSEIAQTGGHMNRTATWLERRARQRPVTKPMMARLFSIRNQVKVLERALAVINDDLNTLKGHVMDEWANRGAKGKVDQP